MSIAVRNGRGRAKRSQRVRNAYDAKVLTQAVTKREGRVNLSTGSFVLKTTKPIDQESPANS